MKPRLGTVFLVCRDLTESANFYDRLGFLELQPGRRSRKFALAEGVELHLHEELEPAERSLYKVAWQQGSSGQVLSFFSEDVDGLCQRLEADSILAGPLTTKWGTRMIMLNDPDGHRLEFQEPSLAP